MEDKELWIDIPVEERPCFGVHYAEQYPGVLPRLRQWLDGRTADIMGPVLQRSPDWHTDRTDGFPRHRPRAVDLCHRARVIELTIIFIAGGSGLMLGWAILRPGLMRRRDALAQAARKAVYLLLGAVPWLVVAGTIEGFISPNENIAVPVKWMVGIMSGIFLYSYLLLAGRERKRNAEDSQYSSVGRADCFPIGHGALLPLARNDIFITASVPSIPNND